MKQCKRCGAEVKNTQKRNNDEYLPPTCRECRNLYQKERMIKKKAEKIIRRNTWGFNKKAVIV